MLPPIVICNVLQFVLLQLLMPALYFDAGHVVHELFIRTDARPLKSTDGITGNILLLLLGCIKEYTLLSNSGKNILLCWIPMGISGNEIANRAARAALSLSAIARSPLQHSPPGTVFQRTYGTQTHIVNSEQAFNS